MEFVLTGADSLAGSMSIEEEECLADTGAEPVWVCVGGFWRCGMNASTLCSAIAGDMLAHH